MHWTQPMMNFSISHSWCAGLSISPMACEASIQRWSSGDREGARGWDAEKLLRWLIWLMVGFLFTTFLFTTPDIQYHVYMSCTEKARNWCMFFCRLLDLTGHSAIGHRSKIKYSLPDIGNVRSNNRQQCLKGGVDLRYSLELDDLSVYGRCWRSPSIHPVS